MHTGSVVVFAGVAAAAPRRVAILAIYHTLASVPKMGWWSWVSAQPWQQPHSDSTTTQRSGVVAFEKEAYHTRIIAAIAGCWGQSMVLTIVLDKYVKEGRRGVKDRGLMWTLQHMLGSLSSISDSPNHLLFSPRLIRTGRGVWNLEDFFCFLLSCWIGRTFFVPFDRLFLTCVIAILLWVNERGDLNPISWMTQCMETHPQCLPSLRVAGY